MKKTRARAWSTWGGAAALVASATVGAAAFSPAASAATAATVYVRSGATGTGCAAPSATQACPTVQEGITAAEKLTGDAVTVTVGAGTYATSVDTATAGPLASLTIAGAGIGSTVATGGGKGTVLAVDGGTVEVTGLSIDDGVAKAATSTHGGGVYVASGATVTLTDVGVYGSSAVHGGGIYNSGTLRLFGAQLSGDAATDGGGVFNKGVATISGTSLGEVHATFDGGGILTTLGQLSLTTSDLVFATAGTATNSGFGGGLNVVTGGPSPVVLAGDVFQTDSASTGGGGAAIDRAGVDLVDDRFVADSAGGAGGGGAAVTATALQVTGSTFTGDHATGFGGGLSAHDGGVGGHIVLTRDTFAGDSAFGGGGAALFGTATVTNDTFTHDGAAFGGGIAASGSATLVDDTFFTDTAESGGGIASAELGFFGPERTPRSGPTQFTLHAAIGNTIFDTAGCESLTLTDLGYNVLSSTGTGCGFSSAAHDVLSSTSIGLTPTLAPNTSTGPETLAIGPTSSAFEEVPAPACTPHVDERTKPRPGVFGASCDAGAYEYQGAAPHHQITVVRIYGQTADATAAAELESVYTPDPCPGTTGDRPVVLATDQHYPDALASAYLAKDLGTGTLLTPGGSLSAVTATALRKEGITHVYVVGGPLAVSTAVVETLEATPAYTCGGTRPLGTHITVTRIAGATATTTAAAIATFPAASLVGRLDLAGAYAGTDALGGKGRDNTTAGSASAGPSATGALPTAIVATEAGFQDAEAAATLSYAGDLPVLLTTPGSLPTATRAALLSLGIRQVIVTGGPLAVSTAVVSALESMGISVLRVAGADYTGTAVELAGLETGSAATHLGLGWDTHPGGFAVARGDYYADGLAGAIVAAHGLHGSGPVPLLLTESPTTIGSDLAQYLRHVGGAGIGSAGARASFLIVLGGPEAVTPSVVSAMVSYLG